MSDRICCLLCGHDGAARTIADLHWNGLGVHIDCLTAVRARAMDAESKLDSLEKTRATTAEMWARECAHSQDVEAQLKAAESRLEQVRQYCDYKKEHSSICRDVLNLLGVVETLDR